MRSELPSTCTYQQTHTVFRAMQMWPPEFIPYASPFIACTIIGPTFDNVRGAHLLGPNSGENYLELLKLLLRRIGVFWGLGHAAFSK
jgi:hypothetical protein